MQVVDGVSKVSIFVYRLHRD